MTNSTNAMEDCHSNWRTNFISNRSLSNYMSIPQDKTESFLSSSIPTTGSTYSKYMVYAFDISKLSPNN